MGRRFIKVAAAFVPIAIVIALPYNTQTHATINYNNLITDAVFDNSNAMTASQIDSFLNGFPSSCISNNNGFRAIDPTGYNPSQGYLYGGNVTAGKVIFDAAAAYELNPQVLLATLQKEQSLVSGGSGCSTLQYVGAMGYGCPDGGTTHNYSGVNLYTLNGHTVTSVSGTCVNTSQKAGFSQQIIHAAWLLKFDRMRSEGNVTWAIIKTNWDNSDDLDTTYSGFMTQGSHQRCSSCASTYYDGYATIDGTSVHMDNGATASLYVYTPHKSGNSHFVTIFTSWFGSTIYPWAASVTTAVYSDAARTSPLSLSNPLPSGTTIYVTVSAVNTGNQAWSNSFVNIGTSDPHDHHSSFQDSSWLSWARPARLVEPSVAPEQTGTFKFSLTTPSIDGTYHENFGIVAESRGWLQDATFGFDIVVSNPYNALVTQVGTYANSTHTQRVDSSEMAYGQKVYVQAKVKNIGTQTWDSSFTNVGTSSPHDRTSQFQDPSWLSAARPAHLVEPSVAPGATGTIEFPILAPATNLNTTEVFGLVADGKANGWMPAVALSLHIQTVPAPMNRLLPNVKLYTGTGLRSANNIYNLAMQKDGNLVIYGKGKPIWASNTGGQSVSSVVMQADGNLVIYATNGKPIWATHTGNRGSSYLAIQDDGNLVIYHNGQATWASNTGHNIANTASILRPGDSLPVGGLLLSGNSKYSLAVRARTIALSSPNRTLWSVNFGSDLRKLVMQYDGNLVAYSSSSHPLWATGTTGVGSYLAMQDDGNLVIYHNGQATWASHTGGLV